MSEPISNRLRKCKKFYNPHFGTYDNDERKYFNSLSDNEKAKLITLESDIVNSGDDHIPIRFKIINSKVDLKVKRIAMKKVRQLSALDPSTGEYYKTMRWTSSLCDIPVGTYKRLPVDMNSPQGEIKKFIDKIRSNMDAKVFGHADAKEQIVRLLCQWISNPRSKGMVIGVQGPMGCGKTTLIKHGICEVLGLPFAFVPLGGASGSDFLDGHSFTYEGSTWGKIVESLMQAKCMNPVLFFDELDKVSETQRGDEIINYLIHLTDATQNDKITDKYFPELEFDLSRSLIIFSYNDESKVSPVLRDRMYRIHTKGYNSKDKVSLVTDYLVPEALNQHGMKPNDIVVPTEVVPNIIETIEQEEGVRNLKRAVEDIVGHVNMKRMLDKGVKLPYRIETSDVNKMVGKSKNNAANVLHNMMYV